MSASVVREDPTPVDGELTEAAAYLLAGESTALANPLLIAPLATSLKVAARLAKKHKADPSYWVTNGFRWCLECDDEECEAFEQIDAAVAVARVILGRSS